MHERPILVPGPWLRGGINWEMIFICSDFCCGFRGLRGTVLGIWCRSPHDLHGRVCGAARPIRYVLVLVSRCYSFIDWVMYGLCVEDVPMLNNDSTKAKRARFPSMPGYLEY